MGRITFTAFLCVLMLCSSSFKKTDKGVEVRLPNPDGDTLALSSLRGKVVLVDVWASWCKPCRKANPVLNKLYQKYKDKSSENASGFEIYSISLDVSKAKWKSAIAEDNLLWPNQVNDVLGNKGSTVKLLKIRELPTNMLLSPEGEVLEKNIRAQDLEFYLKKLLN